MRQAQRGYSVDPKYNLRGSESELNSQRERSSSSYLFAIQRAENNLLNIFWKHSVNVTPSVQGEVTEVFNTLKDNLKSFANEGGGFVPRDNGRIEIAQEDLESLKERMAISTQSIYATLDKIDLELSYLSNSLKYKTDSSPEYLGQRKVRSSSQSTMKVQDEDSALKLKELKNEMRKLSDELKKKESYAREVDILSQRVIELISAMPQTGEIYRKENTMKQGELLRKDELIRKLQAELEASNYLLKRKNEEGSGNTKAEQALNELCSHVNSLLFVMQRLQRAIAKNDNRAIPSLQQEFEHRKKQLSEYSQIAGQQYGGSSMILKLRQKRNEDTPTPNQGENSLNSSLTKFKVRPVNDDGRMLERKVQSLEQELMNAKKTIKEYKEITENQVQQLNINKRALDNYVLSIEEKNKKIEDLTQLRIRLERDCRRLADENSYKQIIIDQKMKEVASFTDNLKLLAQENKSLLVRESSPQHDNYREVEKTKLKKLLNTMMQMNKNTFNDMNMKAARNINKLNIIIAKTKVDDKASEYDQKISQLTSSLKKVQAEKAKMLQDLDVAEQKYKKASADKQIDAKKELQTIKQENDELKASLKGMLSEKEELERLLRQAQSELRQNDDQLNELQNKCKELTDRLVMAETDSIVNERSAKRKEKNIKEQAAQCINEELILNVEDRLNEYELKIKGILKNINTLIRKYKDTLNTQRENSKKQNTKENTRLKRQIEELNKSILSLQEKNKDEEEQYNIQKDTLNQQWETIALKDEAIKIEEQKHSMDIEKLQHVINDYNSKLVLIKDQLLNFSNKINNFSSNEEKVKGMVDKIEELLVKVPLVKEMNETEEYKEIIKGLEEEKEQLSKSMTEKGEQEKYIIEESIQELNRFYMEKLAEVEERLNEIDRIEELQGLIEIVKDTTRMKYNELMQEADRASKSSALEKGAIVNLRAELKNCDAITTKVKKTLERVLKPKEGSLDELLEELETRIERETTSNSALKEATDRLSEENDGLKVQVTELEGEVESQRKENQKLSERMNEFRKDQALGTQALMNENEELKEQVNTEAKRVIELKENVDKLNVELESIKNNYMQEVEILTKEKNSLEEELTNIEQQVEELNMKIIELDKENSNKLEEINKLTNELDGKEDRLNELVETNNALKEQVTSNTSTLNSQIIELQQELGRAKTDLETISKERNEIKGELESTVEKTKSEAEKEGVEYKEKYEQLEEELKLKKEVTEALNENLTSLANENFQLKEQLNTLQSKVEQSDNELAESIDKYESDIGLLKKDIEDKEKTLGELTTQLEDYKTRCKKLEDKLTQQAIELNNKLELSTKENKELQERIENTMNDLIVEERSKRDNELTDVITKYEETNNQLQSEVNEYKELNNKLTMEFEQYKESTNSNNEKQINELETINKENTELKEELKLLKDAKELLAGEVERYKEDKTETEGKQQQELEEMKRELESTKELSEYKVKYDTLQTEYNMLQKYNEGVVEEKENIEREIIQLKEDCELYKTNINTSTKEIDEYKEKNEELINEVDDYKETINDLREELKIYSNKESDTVEEYKKTCDELRVQLKEQKTIAEQLQSSLEEYNNDNELLQEDINKDKADYEELKAANKKLVMEISEVKEESKGIKDELDIVKTENEEYKDMNKSLKEQLKLMQDEYNTLNEKFSKSVIERDEFMSKSKTLEDDFIKKEEHIGSLQNALESLNNEKIELEQNVKVYKTQNESLVLEQSSQLQGEIAEYTKKCADLEEKNENLTKTIEELQNQYEIKLQTLEASNNELNSKLIEYEKEITSNKQELDNLKSFLEGKENRVKELESALLEKEGKENNALITITMERDSLNMTLEELKTEIENVNTKVKELETTIKQREEQIEEWKQKFDEASRTNEELSSTKEKDKESVEATLNQMRIMAEELQAEKERLEETNDSLKEEKEILEATIKELQEDYNGKAEQYEQLLAESNQLQADSETLKQENAKLEEKVIELTQYEQELTEKLEAMEKAKNEEFNLMFGQDEEGNKEDIERLVEDKEPEDFKVDLAEDEPAQMEGSEQNNSAEDELARVASERENYQMQVVSLTDIQESILEKLAEEGITDKDPIHGIEELIQKYRKELDDFKKASEYMEGLLLRLQELLPEDMQGSVTNQDELIAAISQVLTDMKKGTQASPEVEKLQANLVDKNNQLMNLQTQHDTLSNEVSECGKE
jgi:chromosome segregation ATPase